MERVLNQREAMFYLHVSKSTLHRWDKDGTLVPFRTSGGHRRYFLSALEEFAGKREEDKKSSEQIAITYARCSTNEQKQHGDIERQSQRVVEYCVKKKYKIEDIIKDCGSGLNDQRRGFIKLCDMVTAGNIDVVVVENKDRLSRFGFNMLQYFFSKFGTRIEVIENKSKTPEEEITSDMIMLLASFSGKLYSLRGQKHIKERKQKESK